MAYYTNSIVNSSVMEGIVASVIIVCLLSSMSSGHYTNIEFNEDFRIPRNCILQSGMRFTKIHGGTAAAAPPPFRPSDPALCGSRPLVTPYYCRLADLLCYSCTLYLSILCVFVYV